MFEKNQYRSMAAFFLVFGCIVGKGLFLGISVLLLIIHSIKNNDLLKVYFERLKSIKSTVIVMGLFISGLLISSIFSPNGYGLKETVHYLERMLPFFLVLFCIVDNRGVEKYLAAGLLLGSCVICADALYSYFYLNVNRPSGILGSANILGGTLILLAPFLYLYLYKLRQYKKIFLFSIFTIVIASLTLFIIKSRGAWLGLACSMLFIPIILYKIKKISLKKIVLIFAIVIIASMGIYINFNDVFHRSYDYERPALRNIAVHMFADNPLVGVGMGNFTSRYIGNNYISPLAHQEHYLSHAHNIYFKFLSETGIIGISGFLILIGYQLKVSWENINTYQKNSLYAMSMLLSMIGMLAHGWFDVCFSARYYAMLYWCLWGVVYYNLLNCDTENLY